MGRVRVDEEYGISPDKIGPQMKELLKKAGENSLT